MMLGNQSPTLRQTAAFNSIAMRGENGRVSGQGGLDDSNRLELLRTSSKELMCEAYSRPHELESGCTTGLAH